MNCPFSLCNMDIQESIPNIPCSLGIPNCKKSFQLEYCTPTEMYHTSVQPRNIDQIPPKLLNTLSIYQDVNQYTPVTNKDCNGRTSYAGSNPILIDAPRAQKLLLNQPNYTGDVAVGDVDHDEIYDPKFNKIGRPYSTYNDMVGGSVQYYLPFDAGEAYIKPVYSTPSIVQHTTKINPMGVVYNEYERIPLSKYAWDACNKDACDSYTHDQLEYRQDLMAAQSRKRNQQEYKLRWG